MSQYRVTLRGMLPIELEVIVEGNTIAEAKENAKNPHDDWIGNPRVWAVDSCTDYATNEIDVNPSDVAFLKLRIAETKVVRLLKSDEVEV